MTGRIWRHIWGYVIIKVKGPRLERFLNRLAGSGIHVWQAERITSQMLVASVSVSSFRKIRRLSRAQGWNISILEKAGLPFIVRSVIRRKTFVIGCIWALLMLYAASGFVWFVRVDIDDAMIPAEQVMSVAAEYGLKPGARREKVDRHRIRQALLLAIDELSWVSVDVRGVLATVDVYGRAGLDLAIKVPGDIVAAQDGIITKVIVFSGQSVVEEGDVVKRGDLLISGFIPPSSPRHRELLETDQPPYDRADGIVMARTWIERTVTVPLVTVIEEPTGRQSRLVTLHLGESSFAIGRKVPHFDTFRAVSSSWKPGVGRFGAGVTVTTYEEVTRHFTFVAESEALETGRKAVLEEMATVLKDTSDPLEAMQVSTDLVDIDGMPALDVTARIEMTNSISSFRETVF